MHPPRPPPAGDFDYDARPGVYARTRQADPRIAACVREALADARTVLNVGAGSGNYEPSDRLVVALEPSASMRAQRPRDAAPCVIGAAEELPFDAGAFDAVMAVFTIHQWRDLAKGLAEMRRVARKRVVILTFDPAAFGKLWTHDYLPERTGAEGQRMPTLENVAAMLGPHVEFAPAPVPFDCIDGFTEAFYGRPEFLLDPAVRAGQSGWAFIGADAEARFVARLRADLDSGAWDEKYGAWRALPAYDAPLRLLIANAEDP